MTDDALIALIQQLQVEVETLGVRGVNVASAEQINWFRHTRDRVAEMGAEHLAQKMSPLIESMEGQGTAGSARLLDLLTTIRVFDRVLTLQIAEANLAHMAAAGPVECGDAG